MTLLQWRRFAVMVRSVDPTSAFLLNQIALELAPLAFVIRYRRFAHLLLSPS